MILTKEHFCLTVFGIWSFCGVAKAFQGRIVNGTQAKEGEFPFMVSLRRTSSGRHSCGASLLNRVWVVTAAHCVASSQPAQVNIQYGSIELDVNATQVTNVSKIYVHESYDPHNKHIHDIALLRLQTPVKFGAKVRAVHLPATQQFTPANSSAVLIGWGLNLTGGVIQKHMQKVHLQTFSDEECSARHETDIHETTICAGVPEGGKGQCSGDSGGPLLVNGTQVGIVSWSRKPCTIAPYPGVFTELSAYVDWIQKVIGDDTDGDWDDSDESLEELMTGNLIIVKGRSPLFGTRKKHLNKVSLRHTKNNMHFCAGTIIAAKWVLTAAHCFMYINAAEDLWIQYGRNRLKTKMPKPARVKQIIKHAGYNPTIAIHDIALLELLDPIKYAYVSAVRFANIDVHAENSNITVVLLGWGLNETTGQLQQTLQKVSLQLYTLKDCQQLLHSFLHKTQLCAGAKANSLAGQCSGDSGGPLLLQQQQIGIVSWSLKPCGTYPGVYTNIAFYRQWIMNTTHAHN